MSKLKEYNLNYLIVFIVLISIITGCKVNNNDNSQITVKPEWAEWIKNNHWKITNLEQIQALKRQVELFIEHFEEVHRDQLGLFGKDDLDNR